LHLCHKLARFLQAEGAGEAVEIRHRDVESRDDVVVLGMFEVADEPLGLSVGEFHFSEVV
jgi:hypothetical protein